MSPCHPRGWFALLLVVLFAQTSGGLIPNRLARSHCGLRAPWSILRLSGAGPRAARSLKAVASRKPLWLSNTKPPSPYLPKPPDELPEATHSVGGGVDKWEGGIKNDAARAQSATHEQAMEATMRTGKSLVQSQDYGFISPPEKNIMSIRVPDTAQSTPSEVGGGIQSSPTTQDTASARNTEAKKRREERNAKTLMPTGDAGIEHAIPGKMQSETKRGMFMGDESTSRTVPLKAHDESGSPKGRNTVKGVSTPRDTPRKAQGGMNNFSKTGPRSVQERRDIASDVPISVQGAEEPSHKTQREALEQTPRSSKKEREALEQTPRSSKKEREALEQTPRSSKKEREALEQTPRSSKKEREALEQTPRSSKKEREALQQTPRSSKKEREALEQTPRSSKKERETLQQTPRSSKKEREALEQTPRSSKKERGTLQQTPRSSKKEREALQQTPRSSKKEREALEQTPRSSKKEREALEQTPRSSKKEREALQQTPRSSKKERETLEQTPRSSKKEREALEQTPRSSKKEREALEQTPRSSKKEREALEQTPRSSKKTHTKEFAGADGPVSQGEAARPLPPRSRETLRNKDSVSSSSHKKKSAGSGHEAELASSPHVIEKPLTPHKLMGKAGKLGPSSPWMGTPKGEAVTVHTRTPQEWLELRSSHSDAFGRMNAPAKHNGVIEELAAAASAADTQLVEGGTQHTRWTPGDTVEEGKWQNVEGWQAGYTDDTIRDGAVAKDPLRSWNDGGGEIMKKFGMEPSDVSEQTMNQMREVLLEGDDDENEHEDEVLFDPQPDSFSSDASRGSEHSEGLIEEAAGMSELGSNQEHGSSGVDESGKGRSSADMLKSSSTDTDERDMGKGEDEWRWDPALWPPNTDYVPKPPPRFSKERRLPPTEAVVSSEDEYIDWFKYRVKWDQNKYDIWREEKGLHFPNHYMHPSWREILNLVVPLQGTRPFVDVLRDEYVSHYDDNGDAVLKKPLPKFMQPSEPLLTLPGEQYESAHTLFNMTGEQLLGVDDASSKGVQRILLKKEMNISAGPDWQGFRKTRDWRTDPKLKQDFKMLRQRNEWDPKRKFKSLGWEKKGTNTKSPYKVVFPEIFQVGHIAPDPKRPWESLPKHLRDKSLTEQLMADPDIRKNMQKKFRKKQEMSGGWTLKKSEGGDGKPMVQRKKKPPVSAPKSFTSLRRQLDEQEAETVLRLREMRDGGLDVGGPNPNRVLPKGSSLGGTGPLKPGEIDKSELEWGGKGRRARQKRARKRREIEEQEEAMKKGKHGRGDRTGARKKVRKEDLKASKTREGKRAVGKLSSGWPRR